MPFTDDFNGPANQALTARTGWSLAFGTDSYKVNAGATKLTKTVTGSALDVYFRTDDSSTVQSVKGDLGAGQAGLILFASGTSSANFNAYYLRASSSTSVRVTRYDNGVASGNLIVVTVADLVELELRAHVNEAGNTVLQVFSHGVQKGVSYVDNSASKKTSGRRGVISSATGTITDWLDNYVDNYNTSSLTIRERNSGFVFEGMRQTSNLTFTVGWNTTITTLEARLEDGSGNAAGGTSWTTKVASPAAAPATTSISFTGIAAGGPYYLAIRDSADPTNSKRVSLNCFYVGGVVIVWGQSQCSRLGTVNLGGLSPTAGIKATYMQHSNGATSGSMQFLDVLSNYSIIGSAIVGICNQWHEDTGGLPLMIVHCAIPGTSLAQWISDTASGGWGLWTGVADTYLDYCERQASAVLYMQGTSDLGSYVTYQASMVTFQGMWQAQLTGQDPLFLVVPHQRSNDGANTWAMRNEQYQKAISGGKWAFCCWLLDWEMDGDTSPHQSANAAGNKRAGPRIGRGIAKNLYNSGLDNVGAQILLCKFTDINRNVIEITYDRAIETPAAVTTALPGFSVSMNSGSTFARWTDATHPFTVAITASNKVQLTKTTGAWVQTTTKIDYLRGVPFTSDAGNTAEYVGAENTIEAGYLAKVLTDTTSFDGGRGMPVPPVMLTGRSVLEYTATLNTGAGNKSLGSGMGMGMR